MASSAAFAILLVFAVAVQSARGMHIPAAATTLKPFQLACEQLPPDVCAFAVSSSRRRCVLERTPEGVHLCQTSAVRVARGLAGWVETDACVRACGVDRAELGLPVTSAVAEDRRSFRALCSSACRYGCPNVVDLYATLAAAEGMSLPALCEAHYKTGNRRMMTGMAAPAPAPAPCEE